MGKEGDMLKSSVVWRAQVEPARRKLQTDRARAGPVACKDAVGKARSTCRRDSDSVTRIGRQGMEEAIGQLTGSVTGSGTDSVVAGTSAAGSAGSAATRGS